MTAGSGPGAVLQTGDSLGILATFHHLRVTALGDDLGHQVRTLATLFEAELLALVTMRTLLPDLVTHLPALVLLVSLVIGVAGELAHMATWQPGITEKVAATLGELLSDVLGCHHFLQR